MKRLPDLGKLFHIVADILEVYPYIQKYFYSIHAGKKKVSPDCGTYLENKCLIAGYYYNKLYFGNFFKTLVIRPDQISS